MFVLKTGGVGPIFISEFPIIIEVVHSPITFSFPNSQETFTF